MRYEQLLGRTFIHGSVDCYSIVRDFYRDNFGIALTNFARPDGWWDTDLNLYMNNFRAEGFETTDLPPHQARAADVFLLAIKSTHANHAGIYLGNGQILHHYLGRLSEVVPLTTMWRNPCAIVRHRLAVIDEPTTRLDLFDLLPPHKQEMIRHARAAS